MKTAVIYARYSSKRQTEQSIEGQFRECMAYAEHHDMMVVDTYIDRAMTGNDKAATSLAAAAATIWSNAQRDAELSLKRRAQETRDAQLALAREKFEAAEKRLAAASATVADPSLTAEEKLKELDRLFGR